MILLETLRNIPDFRGNGGAGVSFLPEAAKAAASALVGGPSSGKGRGVRGGEGGGEGEGEDGGGGGGGLSRAVLFSKVFAEEEDLNRIVSVECASRPGAYIQVGGKRPSVETLPAAKTAVC